MCPLFRGFTVYGKYCLGFAAILSRREKMENFPAQKQVYKEIIVVPWLRLLSRLAYHPVLAVI